MQSLINLFENFFAKDSSNGLNRFLAAQEDEYERAYNEIKNGHKETHWMWFIFPQIQGLGESYNAKFFAIKDKNETLAYYRHEILGKRLKDMCQVLLELQTFNPYDIFNELDALKLKSSMTLFYLVTKDVIFLSVLKKFYGGKMCSLTIKELEQKGRY